MRRHWPGLSAFWAQLKIVSDNLQSHLKYVYLAYAMFMVLLTAIITPGFESPDEHSHFARVEQITRGVFVGRFVSLYGNGEHRTSPDKRVIYPDSGGYYCNRGILLSANAYSEINFNPENKVTRTIIDNSNSYYWNKDLVLFHFPNTVIYPPTGYFFPTLGVLTGKWMNLTILRTLFLSRILNGIGCIIICFFALGLANKCRLVLFFVLLLPLTISLFASVSQDPMLISLAALLVGLIDHVESGEKKIYTPAQLFLLVLCITVISAAKPPYFLFIFVFLFLHLTPRIRLYCIAIPFLLVCCWGILNLHNYGVAWAPAEMKFNSQLQMAYVMAHPFRFMGLFFHWDFYAIKIKLMEFIGILGWLDLILPNSYYRLAFLLFILSFIIILNLSRENLKLRMAFIIATLITFIAVLIAQYITWVPLESPELGGLQSRYFIPLVPFLAVGLAGFGKAGAMKNWQIPIFLLLLVFPLITHIIMVHGFIVRYYLN